MASVKTAISVGASTLARIDALAREMNVPRSRLFALAAEEFLDRHDARGLMAAIDQAHAEAPTAAERKWLRSTRRKHRQLLEGEW
jgi:predicted transcriptional regulator